MEARTGRSPAHDRRLAKAKRLSLCEYTALELEEIRGAPYPAFGYVNLLHAVPLERVDAAVERSKFQQMDMAVYLQKETVVAFYKTLLAIEPETWTRPEVLRRFTEFEQRNLRDLARLKQICTGLPETHYLDAFHLWTAEVNQLDYFLADKKFINPMRHSRHRLSMRTKVLSPESWSRSWGSRSALGLTLNGHVPTKPPISRMASAEDVASAWGLSARTIFRLVAEDLPAEQIGGAFRFDPRRLEEWRRRQIQRRLREVED